MTTEWKLVPVEPTDEMKKTIYGLLSAYKDGSDITPAFFMKMLINSAPVPAVGGEVEVLGYVSFVGKDFVRVALDGPAPRLNTQVANRVYATQLEADLQALATMHRQAQVRWCAERDALKAEVGRLKQLLEQKSSVLQATEALWDESQSELTKARGLLGKAERAGLRTKALGDEVREFLAHQSAPAAKGGE